MLISIDPSINTERENYKLMIGSIIPRPIAFVTSLAKDGTLNGAPFSFFNIVSSNPPLISISVQRKGKEQKDTPVILSKRRNLSFISWMKTNVEKINETSANLPSNESEIKFAGLTEVPSTKVKVPGIKEAKIRLECTLEQVVELGGSDDYPGCDLIIGKVIQIHIDKDIYEDGKINPRGLGAVSRLAGNSYAKIGEIFDIIRPN